VTGRGILVSLGLVVLGSCSVRDLPHLGRTCAGGQPCGPKTRCDPVQLVCVAETTPGDAGVDTTADGPVDGTTDAPAPSRLTCGAAEIVGQSPPASDLSEPALRVNRLQLVARGGIIGMATERTAVDQPFGAWSVATGMPAEWGDPAFFTYQQKEFLISAAGPKPRALRVCPALTNCQAVTITDGAENVLTDDIDGPAVATVDGLPLMIFNMVVLGDPGANDLYQAQATSFDFTSWLAVPLQLQSGPGQQQDDPAISPEGTIVIFGDNEGDLWVARRPQVGAPFAPPGRLDLSPDDASRSEPYLADAGDGQLELFFRATEGGSPSRIKRALCTP
jgi:hypothetical protein